MTYKTERIALSRIDAADFTFRITTRFDIQPLAVSLKTAGLMAPLLLRAKGNSQFCIVSGFRRFVACEKLAWPEVEARILEADTPHLECVRYAVTDNALQRELNPIEISRSLKLLRDHFPQPDRLAKAANDLGMPGNPAIIRKFLPLCDLPPLIQQGILTQSLSPVMALELAELESESAVTLAALFADLRLSLNKQREILQLLADIAARDELTVMDVLSERDLQEILADENADRGMKARNIRHCLKKRRFPAISAAEERYARHIKDLKLGGDLRLIPPKDFEGSVYTFQISFRTISELKARLADLNRITAEAALPEILA
ncbi:MAG: ParB N-terminal domain-containing protein [Desulfobacterales bacterium]